jgi:hypothetical protein
VSISFICVYLCADFLICVLCVSVVDLQVGIRVLVL